MQRIVLAAALAALLSAGCSDPTDIAPPPTETETGTPLPVTRLRAEPYSFSYSSGFTDSTRLTIRDAGQWQQAWSVVWNQSSVPPLPTVDFEHEMVVVAALGLRTGNIFVDSAFQRTDRTVVVVRKESLGKNCGSAGVFYEPVDIARIPASTLPVTFREHSTVHDCG